MPKFDELFQAPADPLFHPRLREWKGRLSKPGVTASLEVSREEVDIGIGATLMDIQFTENGSPQPVEERFWDTALNAGLIQIGVRAVTPENEAMRFALVLRAALDVAAREFGDGFLNGVLRVFLEESELAQQPPIAAVLPHTHSVPLSREGNAGRKFDTCRDILAFAISARAHELRDDLGYTEEEAKRILVEAIAKFLDDRFSVSQRKRRGWI